ncbi:MAG TPA: TIGR03667 family PPOX class F420-dependent oxidoreductase [Anaerolineales bacterium]|nr:TIGR03667 family PPOX class F420-dependent oxidoreductase [Anaerolineales bacterium]
MLDFSTDLGKRAAGRLAKEKVIWLTTVGADGTPQPNPVWFLWESDSFLIYTQPRSIKVRNIRHNPNVALHFNDRDGDDVVVFTGEARFESQVSPEPLAAYLEKYREGIPAIGMTPESFAQSYSVVIRATPNKMRGF